MTTVDLKGRPRARVLIPVWERPDGSPTGWLATYRSPPGAGYDLGRFWTGPSDPELRVLRLAPWRIQVIRGHDLRSRIWRAGASA